MKKHSFKIAASIFLVIVMCMSLFLTGCKGGDKGDDEYAEIAGVYISTLSMSETQSIDLYLQISEDGNFVFARDTEFSGNEKGAGKISKTEDGANAFFYTEINGEVIEEGEKVSTYELNDDGAIQFTSPMWFGSTEPKIIGDDESVSYPVFEKYNASSNQEDETSELAEQVNAEQTEAETVSEETDEKETASTTKSASTTALSTTQKKTSNSQTTQQTTAKTVTTTKARTTTTKAAQTTTKAAQATTAAGFKEGTYKGSLTKYVEAMQTNIKYDATVTFSGGKYNYSVKISAMGQTFDENYSGTYTVKGNSITMTGQLSSGTVSGSSIKIKGVLSSFAGNSEDTITVSR